MAYILRIEEFNNSCLTQERRSLQELLRQSVSALPVQCPKSGRSLKSCWSSVCSGTLKKLSQFWKKKWSNAARVQMNVFAGVKVSRQVFHLLSSFSLHYHQKALLMFKVCFPKSNNWIKKNSSREFKVDYFYFVPDPVKLTLKINHSGHINQLHYLDPSRSDQIQYVTAEVYVFLQQNC